jgi:phage/plasmid-like protein (TIGR03299 family)
MSKSFTNTFYIMDKTEMLINSGLDWKVNSEPLQTVSGILIPDRIALVREDTKKVLGIHTNAYVPYQNDELLELLYRIGNSTGLELHTGGSFKGGQKVYFQLKSNDLKLGNDVIKGYISGFNTFDGTSSLGFGNSSVTVSCMNTFYRGYHEVNTRLRHSASMKPRIEEILSRIDLLMKEEKTMFQEITRLNETRMTPQIKELITKRLFEISVEERLDSNKFSTNLKNRLIRFNYDMEIEVASKGDNLWGLFSSVTRNTSHSMKQGKDNSENKMFGKTGNIERGIYKTLVGLTV